MGGARRKPLAWRRISGELLAGVHGGNVPVEERKAFRPEPCHVSHAEQRRVFCAVPADDAASPLGWLLEILPGLWHRAARAGGLREANAARRAARKECLSHTRPVACHAGF